MELYNGDGKLQTTSNVVEGQLSSDAKNWEQRIYLNTQYIPSAYRSVSPSKIADIFWWAPKFKEWALKLLNLPENERPSQYIKGQFEKF
jgi:hypothetical protein